MDAISTLTTGIADILAERFPVNRWTIEHVPMLMTMEEFKRVLGMTPWLGISWREVRPDPNAGRSTPERLAATVTVIVKNAGGKAGRLLGDGAGPGLYPSVELARHSLHTRAIEGIGTLVVTRAGQAYSDGWGDLTVAVGVIELEALTRTPRPIGEGEEPPDFASLATTWDFALGEDSPADNATDIIEPGEPS
jgi:hypothetical protein